MASKELEIKVWDISTRVFHWALVVSVTACWVTIKNRWMLAHQISGLSLLFLLIFRLIWAFVGSRTARLSDFLTSPWSAVKYLWSSLQNHDTSHTGHNPAGGWMIILFFIVLLVQVLTGLIANNDLGFSGPLADQVMKDTSDQATRAHGLNFSLLLLLVWTHLVAVFFYYLVKRQAIIQAMFSGRKPLSQIDGYTNITFAPTWRVIAAVVCSAALLSVVFLI
ncbi:MAG: cytochrome b/b6 domain-containing protein [Pseudomonadota bacterium]